MKLLRNMGTGHGAHYERESTRSWERFVLSEGLGVDALEAKLLDLDVHTPTILKKLLEWIDRPVGCLYLWGSTGCGKTYAGITLIKYLFNSKPNAWIRYLEASKISDLGRSRGSSWIQEIYSTCEMLMVDDLGVDVPAEWQQRYTYDLFDMRCAKLKLPTIVTSNLPKEELSKIVSPRVTSRLFGIEVELITGDLRK